MKVSFHEIAEKEFINAIEYYEECQEGLGERFSKEIYATIKRIFAKPKMRAANRQHRVFT